MDDGLFQSKMQQKEIFKDELNIECSMNKEASETVLLFRVVKILGN
ncbi:TPA: hypothetical protein QFC14_002497 [Enterococcus faecium]|nr:hypothetical protein [Enterococcus faecium]EME3506765.1 hypothetical protein [Enterococcus faecium]EME8145399.1 hypothetical protein [Enterococcus faecium]EME8201427.1 hypothetical protein [Enterococcus faecium]